jgi:thiol-disulfide isomerase/thioredoxin
MFATALFAGPQIKDRDAYKAQEIRKSDIWINSGPLTLKSLRGQVVVVDFSAFDCEPCIDAMPHIQEVYDKYAPQGLVVIGVHTPRAEYERDVAKLRIAIKQMELSATVMEASADTTRWNKPSSNY